MKNLCVYDFDHTLVHTSSKIRLKETSETVSQQFYEEYIKVNGFKSLKHFDFSDYDAIVDPVPIEQTLSRLMCDLEQKHDCFILTARRNPLPIAEYLPTLLSGKTVPVVSVNDSKFRFNWIDGDHKRKAAWIANKLSKNKYSSFCYYEDSEKNALEVFRNNSKNSKLNVFVYIVKNDTIAPI